MPTSEFAAGQHDDLARAACATDGDAAAEVDGTANVRANRWWHYAVLTAATLGCLAPFLRQPFHIDDPLFVWTAEQVASRPLDFYGFEANWWGWQAPMTENMKNPPLASYYLALPGRWFGFDEAPLHAAMLVPALFVVWGVYALAQRMGVNPLLAGLATLALPVFLMSATMVMCDTLLLALWTWAVVFWIDGVQRRQIGPQAGAAICMSLAALTKYFGLCLAPLLLVYALAERRRLGWWALWLLAPLATLAGYEAWTTRLYGVGLVSDAASYTAAAREYQGTGHELESAFVALLFLGGCVAGVVAYAPRIWSLRVLLAALVVACLASLAAVSQGWLDIEGVGSEMTEPHELANLALHVLFMSGAGLTALALVVTDAWRRRDRFSILLGLWVLGTFGFAGFLNWTINGRTLLPLAPAVAILLVRCIDRPSSLRGWRRWAADYLPLGFGLAIGLAGAWGNYALAVSNREAADIVMARYGHGQGRLWFQGHWGFQHRMQRLGATPLDTNDLRLEVGDVVVIPRNNTNTRELAQSAARWVEEVHVPIRAPVATTRSSVHAGFYASVLGRLPYVMVGDVPPDRYTVLRMREPLRRRVEE